MMYFLHTIGEMLATGTTAYQHKTLNLILVVCTVAWNLVHGVHGDAAAIGGTPQAIPSTSTCPVDGRSSPAMRRSVVVLMRCLPRSSRAGSRSGARRRWGRRARR